MFDVSKITFRIPKMKIFAIGGRSINSLSFVLV